MKKFNVMFFAILVSLVSVSMMSCEKDKDVTPVKKEFAKYITGNFSISADDGDILLKSKANGGMRSAPGVGGHEFGIWKQTGSAWTLVDGSEFLPGSAPALDWSAPGANPRWFSANSNCYVTYCPVLPLRFVVKATVGGPGTAVSYLGIHDCTPNAETFPLPVKTKRVGDVVTLNTNALTALPGYRDLSFTISYTKSIIDIDRTIQTSLPTTNAWPNYVYSAVVPVVEQPVVGSGNVTVYEGLDAKITGEITIKIYVDGHTITKKIDALGLGKGMKIILTTSKVGWYNSGNFALTHDDIVIETVEVPVE